MTVHDRRDTTLECLRHLFAQDCCSLSVYMTDDGCTDGTSKAVASTFPSVHIVPGDGTLYWNGGMRRAWEVAAGTPTDFFLWLNDDTFLCEGALQTLLSVSSTLADKAIVVGTTAGSDGNLTYGGRDSSGNLLSCDATPLDCVYMNGNIVLIPRAVFETVGFNDAHYVHSLGDFDYGLTAREKGIKVVAAPGVCGICEAHGSLPAWSDPARTLSARLGAFFSPTGANPFEFFYYRRKHFGLAAACLTFVSNFIHVLFPRLWGDK